MKNTNFGFKRLVIVGGGVVGCYAAYLAAQKKIPVKLFEKNKKQSWLQNPLLTRRCGEGVWLEKLRRAKVGASLNSLPEYVENTTDSLWLGRLKKDKINFIKLKVKPYLFLNRQLFMKNMAKKARSLGADWCFGEEIENTPLLFSDGSFLLGAWGTNPPLLASVLRKNYCQKYVLACQQTFKGIDSTVTENSKIVVLADAPEIRYFYLFPKANGRAVEANVGVVFNEFKVKNPFKKLERLIKKFPGSVFEKIEVVPGRNFVKIIGCGPPIESRHLLAGNFVLIGDAGFTTDPVSGGGIGYGFWSAFQAVETFSATDPRREYYSRMVPLIKKLKKSYSLSQVLYSRNLVEKKRVNDRFFSAAKNFLSEKKVFSLSKVAQLALTNL